MEAVCTLSMLLLFWMNDACFLRCGYLPFWQCGYWNCVYFSLQSQNSCSCKVPVCVVGQVSSGRDAFPPSYFPLFFFFLYYNPAFLILLPAILWGLQWIAMATGQPGLHTKWRHLHEGLTEQGDKSVNDANKQNKLPTTAVAPLGCVTLWDGGT